MKAGRFLHLSYQFSLAYRDLNPLPLHLEISLIEKLEGPL
jgi:hypothetical protein